MREAEISVSDADFEAMGVEELFALGRDAGLLDVEELACRGDGGVVRVEVASRFDEDRLSSLSYVDQWTHVAERDGSHVYVVSFTAPSLPDRLRERADDLVGTCDPEIEDRGATMSLVGSHGAISGSLADYEDAGVSPDLRRIGGYDGGERPLDRLTDRQREVIETAWEMGYYEVPREVPASAVATELDLDGSTVSEHLQRAERNLLSQLL